MLTFQNKGLIDLAAITTFGVSVKEGKNPIGFFGTGLKFALAITARLGGKIVLYHGLQRIEFKPSKIEVRGKQFGSLDMIVEGGQTSPLPFTTELGKLWKPWQAFRELFCNGMDEPEFTHAQAAIRPKAGYTTLEIHNCPQLEEAYRDRGVYILDSKPAFATKQGEVHSQPGAGLYYRGVLVAEGKNTAYTYNLLRDMTLTEDRTLKDSYTYYYYLGEILLTCTDSTMCKRIITAMCDGGTVESLALNYCSKPEPSPEFLTAAKAAHRKLGDRLPKELRTMLEAACPKEFGPKAIKLSKFDQAKVSKAVRFLAAIGHKIDYQIKCVESLGEGILGQAKDETIWLSRLALDKGVKIIAGAILEEQLHLERGFYDCSREFQDFLLDRYLTVAEEYVYGEPL